MDSELRIYKNKIRRQRIVRRQRIALAFIIALLVFAGFFAVSKLELSAQSDAYVPEYKYYKVITVHSGDTLWDIANENISYDHYRDMGAYISEICSINNILGDKISAGEDIVIPYYSEEFK